MHAYIQKLHPLELPSKPDLDAVMPQLLQDAFRSLTYKLRWPASKVVPMVARDQQLLLVLAYWKTNEEIQEVFFLKLKARGEELDPRYFDAVEKKALQAAYKDDWAQWIRNTVVRRVPAQAAKKVPRNKTFPISMRIIRVNRSKVV